MKEKPVLSPDFTIEDIHKLREYNFEQTKALSVTERADYYNEKGRKIHELIQEKRVATSKTAGVV